MSWIEDMLCHTIFYALPESINGNDVSFGAPIQAAARVEKKSDVVRGNDGEEKISTHRIGNVVGIPEKAYVWIDGVAQTEENALEVIATQSGDSFDGQTFHVAVCS